MTTYASSGLTPRVRTLVRSVTFLSDQGAAVSAIPTPQLGRELVPHLPIRRIPHYRGSMNTPSEYWVDKMDVSLVCESWLEARWLQLFDFDPSISDLSTQPMRIRGLDQYAPLDHTPDIFIRLTDGTCRLIDVRGPNRPPDPEALRRANLVLAACQALGWEYYLVGEPPQPFARNVAFLAGYRRLAGGHHLRDQILDRAATPVTLHHLLEAVDTPQLARAVTFHLMWRHALGVDVTTLLTEDSLVWSQT